MLAEGKGCFARNGPEEPYAKLRADEQKRHTRLGLRVSQHNMYEAQGSRRQGKCRGCVAKVHALIRGGLSGMRPGKPAAPAAVTHQVTGQESAEVIVGAQGRSWRLGRLETSWPPGTKLAQRPEVSQHRRTEHEGGKGTDELS